MNNMLVKPYKSSGPLTGLHYIRDIFRIQVTMLTVHGIHLLWVLLYRVPRCVYRT